MSKQLTPQAKKVITFAGLSISFIVILITLLLSVYQIESGTRGLVFTTGSLNYVADEGLHFKAPFVQRVKEVDITTQSTSVDKLTAASKDLQTVSANININYRVDANKLIEIYNQTRFDVENRVIQPRIKEALKVVTAKYTAEELITKRTEAKAELDSIVFEALKEYNIIVEDIQLTNFEFSAEFNKAVEAKQLEAQNALKAKNILERTKIEAEQSIVRSKAEAESIRIQSEAIRAQGGQEYVQLKWIQKWDGKMPVTQAGDNSMLMISPTQAK